MLLYCIVVWRRNTSARCQLSDDHSSIQLTANTSTASISTHDAGRSDAGHSEAGPCNAGPEAGRSEAVSAGVLCMSDGASVQSGHSVSFLIQHSSHLTDIDDGDAGRGPEAAAGVGRVLMLSERDGVGLSVTDDVNMDSDDVIFYSFHGTYMTIDVA